MQLSQREKRLLLIAGAVFVVGTLSFALIYEPEDTGESEVTAEMIEVEAGQFDRFSRLLRQAAGIRNRLKDIQNYLPTNTEGQEAKDMLPNELVNIYMEQEILNPHIDPPRNKFIRGIDEYKFLVLKTRFNGPYDQVCRLLMSFDHHGFFINDLRLTNTTDQDLLNVRLTLMKLVRVTEAEQRRRSQVNRSRRRRGI